MVPQRLEIMAQCLQLPTGLTDQYQFTQANTDAWSRAYELDFSAFKDLRSSRPLAIEVYPRALKDAVPLGEKVSLHSVDLTAFASARVDTVATLPLTRTGTVDAVHVSFVLQLDEQQSLQNGLEDIDESTSWACRLWLPHRPISIRPGDSLRVAYRHNPFGSQLEFL